MCISIAVHIWWLIGGITSSLYNLVVGGIVHLRHCSQSCILSRRHLLTSAAAIWHHMTYPWKARTQGVRVIRVLQRGHKAPPKARQGCCYVCACRPESQHLRIQPSQSCKLTRPQTQLRTSCIEYHHSLSLTIEIWMLETQIQITMHKIQIWIACNRILCVETCSVARVKGITDT